MADLRKTPIFDWSTLEFAVGISGAVRTATGQEAAVQVATKAQQTQRGKYSIYGNIEDVARNHIYGSDVQDILVRRDLPEAVRISEIERATREAVIYDPWINDVTDISVYWQKDADGVTRLYTDLTLDTVFGSVTLEGVQANGS